MSDLDRAAALGALDAVYRKVTGVTAGLGEADLMRPTRCAGWAVADVLYHQLLDARRALRTFASPSDAPVDCDDVSYWRDYAPDEASAPDGNGAAAGADESAAHARYVRIAASAYPPGTLAWEWSETAAAACRAARACRHQAVTTQGHVLTVPSFAATLAVSPVSWRSSSLARCSGSSATAMPGSVPCGNSQHRIRTGYRYCSTRWNPPFSTGMISAKSGFSTYE